MDFHPMKSPDYSKQATAQQPVGDIFVDVNKRPAYEKQGDPGSATYKDDQDYRRRPERINREASGATSARSGSVSRDRSSLRSSSSDGAAGSGFVTRLGGSGGDGGEGEYSYVSSPVEERASYRNASQSPSRAMGARSVSLASQAGASPAREAGGRQLRARSGTLEGIGQSVDPVPAIAEEEEAARGRRGYAGPDAPAHEGRQRVLSPGRAMGARSGTIVA